MKRAIISVSDKRGLDVLGPGLVQLRFELVSTGGTAKVLRELGLPVIDVAQVTGFPEMMDGRVKTLHPKIHGGILARRSNAVDMFMANKWGIGLVGVVVVNLYPFAEAAAKPDVTFADLVENIDIGGPSLARAAAKNFTDVLVLSSPQDYAEALEQLATGGSTLEFRFKMARKAFGHTAVYDTQIAQTLHGWEVDGSSGSVMNLPPVL